MVEIEQGIDHEDVHETVRLYPALGVLEEADEPLRQSEILERLDVSKSTTHRQMNRLNQMDFVVKEDDGYSLTDLGGAVAERTGEYVSEVSTAHEYREFLDTLNGADLSLSEVSDAEVTRATTDSPVAPLVRLAELTADASEVLALTNSVAPESFKVSREKMRDGEQEVDMVIDGRIMESLRSSDWFGEEVRQDLSAGTLRLWVHDEPVPYQIGVMDDRLCLGAEDENRMPVAMLETENESAVEWAQREFKRYRERAERLAASDV